MQQQRLNFGFFRCDEERAVDEEGKKESHETKTTVALQYILEAFRVSMRESRVLGLLVHATTGSYPNEAALKNAQDTFQDPLAK